MKGRGGRKPLDVWEHVEKLYGNRVKCKHCKFEFAAPSATRIRSHLYSIPNGGVRGCDNFGQAANGSNERDKTISRTCNLEEASQIASSTREHNKVNEAAKGTTLQLQVETEEKQVGPFSILYNIYNEQEVQLIQYVFDQSRDPSERVVSFPRYHLTRSDFTALASKALLNTKVIDIFVHKLTKIEEMKNEPTRNWYLPMLFSHFALGDHESSCMKFVERPNMKNYFMPSNLVKCDKMFIPTLIESNSRGHYYLHVVDLKSKVVEIWDSCPPFTTEEKRDENAKKLLLVLDKLFKNDKSKRWPFANFSVKMAKNAPKQSNEWDCGVFVIKFMKGSANAMDNKPFESDKERLDLALELLNSELNQEKETLLDRAWFYHMNKRNQQEMAKANPSAVIPLFDDNDHEVTLFPPFNTDSSHQREKSFMEIDNIPSSNQTMRTELDQVKSSEKDEMDSKTNLIDLANLAPEKTKKRKVIAFEVEHAKPKVQGRVLESSVDEVGGEESLARFAPCHKAASSPLENKAHALRTTSIWRTIELEVAGLEEKLDASVAREGKLQDELANLKVKSEKEKAELLAKITALEAKAEGASQFLNQKLNTEGKLKEADKKISLLTSPLLQVKAELDASLTREGKLQDELANLTVKSEKEKADLLAKITALEAKAEEASQFLNQKLKTEGKLKEADGCSTSMTHVFADKLSNSQNFIGFGQPSSVLGLNHLTPSQINQFQAQIQQNMSWQQHNNTLSFLSPKPIPMKHMGSPPKPTKLYRGVEHRDWDKWVAKIRLPKSRTKLCFGPFDTAEEAALAYDKAAYKLKGAFARLNFPNLRHQGSSVDAKLLAICKGLADMQNQGKSEKPKSSSKRSSATGRSKLGSKEAQPYVIDLKGLDNSCKVEASLSPVMTERERYKGSSPLSDLKFADVNEPEWEGASNNFNLYKYPSYEIDWNHIFSALPAHNGKLERRN